jgi:hypothetical protein
VPDLRARLEAATGRPARFNWFVRSDPQIVGAHGTAAWPFRRYADTLAEFAAAGDTIGLHPHAWRARDDGRWVADHGNAAWVEHCVRLAFETFERELGRTCRSIRFGDRFVSARTVQVAASLGARYDLTVEPGMPSQRSLHRGSPATGRIPSQRRAPRWPYRPDARNPLVAAPPGDGGGGAGGPDVWMIPLTAIDSGPLVPLWWRIGRRVRHPLRSRRQTAVLYAPWDAERFWQRLAADLAAAPRPHLAFAIRSDVVGSAAGARNPTFEKLAALEALPLARNVEFTTPAGLVAGLGLERPAPGP